MTPPKEPAKELAKETSTTAPTKEESPLKATETPVSVPAPVATTEVATTIEPATPVTPTRPMVQVPNPQMVSAARGPFPQLEMFSVSPRRHNTMHGTGQRRTPTVAPPVTTPASASAATATRPQRPENPFLAASPGRSAAAQNITRRLADVRSNFDHAMCRY